MILHTVGATAQQMHQQRVTTVTTPPTAITNNTARAVASAMCRRAEPTVAVMSLVTVSRCALWTVPCESVSMDGIASLMNGTPPLLLARRVYDNRGRWNVRANTVDVVVGT